MSMRPPKEAGGSRPSTRNLITTGHNSGDVAVTDTGMARMTSKKILSISLKISTTIAERCARKKLYACQKTEANEQKKH